MWFAPMQSAVDSEWQFRLMALLKDRWLQPRAWLGLLDTWGRTCGNEYPQSNIKRLSMSAGVQLILRRMLKGHKSLSH
ncbi:PREDICTED: 39S ribosomal protein L34, mitochondrial-like [Elephantulus edwardii]|uniref:39S ribosomal protein L34, mitochondrial-like n=1 Tax=Elephantulus edwardii TaxID=28737 RepID=UPI0003F08C14|nr:PREDICTED: 39S ribosomal protein L34, mitochondrial-like [Elephantulus edwardii]